MIEELDQRIGGSAAKRAMNEMVSQIPSGSLTESQVDTFRRLVRTRTVEYLEGIRRSVLLATEEEASNAKLFGPREDPITPFKLKGVTRTPDDAVMLDMDVPGSPGLEQGRYALEDKAGDHAFKMDQARDYAKGLAKGDSGYDGLIYVFSTRDEALGALKQLRRDPAVEALLGKDNAGIHLSFFNSSNGQWELLPL